MAPHGKLYFSAVAVFASLFGLLFSFATLRAGSFSLLGAALSIILLLGALQALERLVRPEKAIQRSRALSASTRRILLTVCEVIRVISFAALFIVAVMHWLGSGAIKDAATNAGELAALLLFIGSCLADLAGQNLFLRATQPIGT
jgi:hypothetical protein